MKWKCHKILLVALKIFPSISISMENLVPHLVRRFYAALPNIVTYIIGFVELSDNLWSLSHCVHFLWRIENVSHSKSSLIIKFDVLFIKRAHKTVFDVFDQKCLNACIVLLFFTLKWHVFDLLIGLYLISTYIDFRAKMENKDHKRDNWSNNKAVWRKNSSPEIGIKETCQPGHFTSLSRSYL